MTNTNYKPDQYEANAAALDAAEDNTETWATIVGPDAARRDIRNFVLGALLAEVDPATFANIIRRAESFAGRPDEIEEGL